jgi:anti-sigma-K factor RskA
MHGHPNREEDFDLYALGVLEDDDKRAIESHAASCAECARKLAEARGRIAMLALGAPRAEASQAVKRRLLAQVRSEQPTIEIPLPGSPRTRPAGRWTLVLAPAALVLAIVSVFLWHQTRDLDRQVAGLRDAMHQQQQQLQEDREVSDLMAAPSTVSVRLAQQPGMPSGTAQVVYNMKMGKVMYEGQIAPAPSAKSYQLWLVPESGNPISLYVFNPVSGQPDHWMMKLPPGVSPKAFAVTIEPEGGMPHPTGPKVLVGAV